LPTFPKLNLKIVHLQKRFMFPYPLCYDELSQLQFALCEIYTCYSVDRN